MRNGNGLEWSGLHCRRDVRRNGMVRSVAEICCVVAWSAVSPRNGALWQGLLRDAMP
jgi:hypothetical protein